MEFTNAAGTLLLASLYTSASYFPFLTTPGNDSTYFAMDNVTGELTTAMEIDREILLMEGVQSFTLDIVATEYKDGMIAEPEDNGSSTQVCLHLFFFFLYNK